jgi:hypothetical protein
LTRVAVSCRNRRTRAEKSEETIADLDQKVRRGGASAAKHRDREWHFDFEKKLNEVSDTAILDGVSAMVS